MILLSMASSWSLGTSPQCPPMTRLTRPSWPKWFRPRQSPSPWPAAYTRVRSRGCPVFKNCFSSVTAIFSAKPMPTNPPVAMVSLEPISCTASSAETTLPFFIRMGGREVSMGWLPPLKGASFSIVMVLSPEFLGIRIFFQPAYGPVLLLQTPG